jgi:diguanylate cyclase
MRPSVKRALQIVVILAITILGALCATREDPAPLTEVYILGLIACGFAGLGLGEIKTPESASEGAGVGERSSPRKGDPTDEQFDTALAVIVKLIQSHLDANSQYSDSLERVTLDLPGFNKPEQIRTIVSLLIDENKKIQKKMAELSENLEASRLQVAKLRSHLAESNEMGSRDPLTSLRNRRFFDENFDKEIVAARNDGKEMCLVVIDLDEFKTINDRFGHPVGDIVLKRFGKILSNNIKKHDTAVRYGGDEFAIIFPGTKIADASHVVDQIRGQLEAKQWILSASNQHIGKVTASFGIARLRRGESAEALLNRADAKLYEAKANGQNRIAIDAAA